MKETLTQESTFKQLNAYFKENREFLPKTLDCKHVFYSDVEATLDIYLNHIRHEVERLGVKGLKNSPVAKSAKNNLFKLYFDLQNIEGWDVEQRNMSNKNKYRDNA
tara:strand:+ start:963 stop:1280 length:318 start_codon:yes stop_codon:yes gene_type:complete